MLRLYSTNTSKRTISINGELIFREFLKKDKVTRTKNVVYLQRGVFLGMLEKYNLNINKGVLLNNETSDMIFMNALKITYPFFLIIQKNKVV